MSCMICYGRLNERPASSPVIQPQPGISRATPVKKGRFANWISKQPKDPPNIVATPCGHLLHGLCLYDWLKKSQTCPQCRSRVTKPELLEVFYPTQEAEEESHVDLKQRLELLRKDLDEIKGKHAQEVERADIAEAKLKSLENATTTTPKKEQDNRRSKASVIITPTPTDAKPKSKSLKEGDPGNHSSLKVVTGYRNCTVTSADPLSDEESESESDGDDSDYEDLAPINISKYPTNNRKRKYK